MEGLWCSLWNLYLIIHQLILCIWQFKVQWKLYNDFYRFYDCWYLFNKHSLKLVLLSSFRCDSLRLQYCIVGHPMKRLINGYVDCSCRASCQEAKRTIQLLWQQPQWKRNPSRRDVSSLYTHTVHSRTDWSQHHLYWYNQLSQKKTTIWLSPNWW